MASFFGCSVEVPVLTVSQQAPISLTREWLEWLVKPVGFWRDAPAAIPDLVNLLLELQNIGKMVVGVTFELFVRQKTTVHSFYRSWVETFQELTDDYSVLQM